MISSGLLFVLSYIFFPGETLSRNFIVPPSLLDPLAEQTAVLNDLEKFTEYNISVLCFTDPGDGPSSIQVPVRTLEDGRFSSPLPQ